MTVHYGSGTDSNGHVYLDSHCRPDFGDVRFVDNDGTTCLSYWMKSKVDGDNGVFWVKINDNLDDDVNIQIKYGNPDAITTSNFDNTFIFGETWSSSTLDASKWVSVDGSPVYTIDTTNHYLSVTDMEQNNWLTGKGFHSRTDIVLPDQYIIEDAYNPNQGVKIAHLSSIPYLSNALFSVHTGPWANYNPGVAAFEIIDPFAGGSGAECQIHASVGGSWWDYDSGNRPGLTVDLYGLIYRAAGRINVKLNDTIRVNEINTDSPTRVHLGISRYSTLEFGEERFYSFLVRKYTTTVPLQSWEPEVTTEHLFYSQFACSSNEQGSTSVLSSYWNTIGESIALEYYRFSIDTGSGYVDQPWNAFSETNNTWANATLSLNYPLGTTIKWKVTANSTLNSITTIEQNFTIGATVQFFFNQGGSIYRDGTAIANGTTTFYNSTTPMNLIAVVHAGRYFVNWNSSTGASYDNPYLYTASTADTVWAYFLGDYYAGYQDGFAAGYQKGFADGIASIQG